VKRRHEQRLDLLAVQAREAAFGFGIFLLFVGSALAITSAWGTPPFASPGALAIGAGLLRFAGSGR
jgi:hypothetical protein